MPTKLISREFTITSTGRFVIEMPFKANITAHLWGGGGGGGGFDSDSPWGGVGSPGLYNTTTFSVNRGDILEVVVGQGGNGGGSINGSSPGGRAGNSRIQINGNNNLSFNGGQGGNSGPIGSGGAGGGGGGASAILINSALAIVAAGGGGGGGAGDGGQSQGQISNASIQNNATGAAATDYRGENGQNKTGNGGGGGAGGGGYPGGQGGAIVGLDRTAYAGQCGGNFPIFSANTGVNTPYYKPGFAAGGSSGGGNGQNGRVFIQIEPTGLFGIKTGGEWSQVSEAFVKISGAWKDIEKIFIKVDDNWREVQGAGQRNLDFVANTQLYSTSIRSFT